MPYKDPKMRSEMSRRHQAKNPAKWRKYHADYKKRTRATWPSSALEANRARQRRRLGIPEPLYTAPAKCECCGRLPGKKPLNADHDHATGRFRGWLCTRCNLGIGNLGDTVHGLRRAIDYITAGELL